MNEVEFESQLSKKLDGVYRKLKKLEEALEDAKKSVQVLQAEEKKEIFKHVPGIEGTFDGEGMVTAENKKYEVPANYAAKSKLVFGDTLKLIELEGKQVFKQVEKVERKEMLAILSKKEGNWHALTDSGSYRISDNAAEHNAVELNDEAIVLIPENNLNAPFAALDEMITKREKKPIDKPAPASTRSSTSSKPYRPKKKPAPKKPEETKKQPDANVSTIREFEEDDLV